MASVEFIEKRIDSAEKKLEKLNKKMERIQIAKASDYEENNPYYYSDYDLRSTTREIAEVETSLAKYKEQLQKENEKAASRNVKVISDFLDKWVKDCILWLEAEEVKYQIALAEYYRKDREYCERFNSRKQTPEERKADRKAHNEMKKQFSAKWSHVTQFNHGSLSWHETMIKDLEAEKIRKYDDIIRRTNDIVGEITDASYLEIAPNGNLDGVIIGTRGKASVQTIGAGGYNIQRFHFRTLIREL